MNEAINSRRAERKIAKAKAKARPELTVLPNHNEWSALNLANSLDLNPNLTAQKDLLQRISTKDVTHQQFIENFEARLEPVVITDVTDSWPAKHAWTLENLLKRFRNERFKCGEDDNGYNVKLKLKYFVHYMKNNCDDSPLYIFDGNFGEHTRKKQLLDDYSLPEYFNEDLFKHASDHRRPPHRWIVIGGARSGTGIHIDPLGTSAWNALLVGYKRWCLFPTYTHRELVKLSPSVGGKQNGEAAQWFNIVYPLTQSPNWPQHLRPIEVLQRPGETMFVPSGWWHVVLNLTDTIAVTQNFVSTTNFAIVWHKTARSRPKLSKKWLAQLQIHRPDLAAVAQRVDTSLPIGIMSDSSSCSSSSSSSNSSRCRCPSCVGSEESEDSGQASLSRRKRRRRNTVTRDESRSSSSDN